MSEIKEDIENKPEGLEQGTYEIIRGRLTKYGDELKNSLSLLNDSRKSIFGAVETTLLATERITTENKCVPRDMVALGTHFIFGYNVHIGLRSGTKLSDVLSVYEYKDRGFHQQDYSLINDDKLIAGNYYY